jgi:hypothetical protein
MTTLPATSPIPARPAPPRRRACNAGVCLSVLLGVPVLAFALPSPKSPKAASPPRQSSQSGPRGRAPQQQSPSPAAQRIERLNSPAAIPLGAPVSLAMHDVLFRFDPDLKLMISRLQGELLPTRPGAVADFDDPHSFFITARAGEVSIGGASLTRLLNGYVFADPRSGLKNIQIRVVNGQLDEHATAHKGIDFPVEIVGAVSATPDGRVRIHPTRVHAVHMPVKPLMGIFGLHLRDFINEKKLHGLAVVGNDLILDPETALPPPHIRARVSRVWISGDRVYETLAPPAPPPAGESLPPAATAAASAAASQSGAASRSPAGVAQPQSSAPNRGYMSYRGGVLKFGRMTMRPADLIIWSAADHRPLDFFLQHYQQQLVASRIRATPIYGWVVYMPPYSALAAKSAAHRPDAN